MAKRTYFGWHPAALAALVVALASGGGLWLHLGVEGETIAGLLTAAGALHGLRDLGLVLPIVALGAVLGLWLGRRSGAPPRAAALGAAVTAGLALAAATPLFDVLREGHALDTSAFFCVVDAETDAATSAIYLAHNALLLLSAHLALGALLLALLSLRLAAPAPRARLAPALATVRPRRVPALMLLALVVAPLAATTGAPATQAATVAATSEPTSATRTPANTCGRVIFADVVALDQPFDYNRLGATNPAGLIYALRRDVVEKSSGKSEAEGGVLRPGQVMLRPDKRPRPLTLRANIGDCLEIRFTNLLDPIPFSDQPADRHVGFHVNGLEVVDSIHSDGTFVGQNADQGRPLSGLVAPGEQTTYKLFAQYENTYLAYNLGSSVGAEANGGTMAFGLFGAINVQPSGWQEGLARGVWQAEWYRSQLTRVEMDMAAAAWDANGNPTVGNLPVWDPAGLNPATGNADGYWAVRTTPDGQPILNYNAVFPAADGLPSWLSAFLAGKTGTPIVNMLAPRAGYDGEVVHSDLNAVITGPGRSDFPNGYYPADAIYGQQDRNEPYREFTVIFQDEVFALQAFPQFFKNPELSHALAIVRDSFGINYGTGGIGSEIIANRLGVGPMANCTECKYEEFFLTAWTVGDPSMVVDIPANQTVDANLAPNGLRATVVKYPDDPSNVHHSYLNDHVKFRNLHAGPKEHHIFHLHSHQWQYNWLDPNSNYLDSQSLGPGAGYTYEIAYGGSGNRNKTPGDSIFHCHFYPHFAMGMWELWRGHETFERGTVLDNLVNGKPVTGARALPDGEILAGTPIPALVPLPSEAPVVAGQDQPVKAMAPMPDPATTVAPYDVSGDGVVDSSQVDLDGNGVADVDQLDAQGRPFGVTPASNPGFPFYIPGLTGHRPPTPPMDIASEDANHNGALDAGEDFNRNGRIDVMDGGLPRHLITGGPNLDPAKGPVTHEQFQTRLDFNKELLNVGYATLDEAGTPAEQVAMGFHSQLFHSSYLPDGREVSATATMTAANGRPMAGFETNGLPAAPGAPYGEPCRSDPTAANGWSVSQIGRNKVYKGVNIQFDLTLNKVGWHFQQQRIVALWDDAKPTLNGKRAPEPLVMRLNATDCAEYFHANLVPNIYQLDDYQVRTPTDIIGQHIHLVKFDVTASDGSANGWNYEDGTLSPDEVRERIHAFRAHTNSIAPGTCTGDEVTGNEIPGQCPVAKAHPYFGGTGPQGQNWYGARTTIQRWYADPLLNNSWDNGVGTVFTHDHYGPSTHQQVGLYSTVLVEPTGAMYRDPETGVMMGGRHDGGPTSWRADILNVFDKDGKDNSHREFYFEFSDFQSAYLKGGGKLGSIDNGDGHSIPSYADFYNAIGPVVRHMAPSGHESDLFNMPAFCPHVVNGVQVNDLPRPCPEAISGQDPGTYVVNYRNEPIGLRVFNGKEGTAAAQTPGDAGDLAKAFATRTDRAIPELNTVNGLMPYPPLSRDVRPGDPVTPMLRVYAGDKVRMRVQVGGHEEEHNFMIHGMKWMKEALSGNSGYRDSEFMGISEYGIFEMPVLPNVGANSPARMDYLYTMGAQTEDLWNGIWGILRAYSKLQPAATQLLPLPNNPIGANGLQINNLKEFNQICPASAPVQIYKVTAVRAADILPEGALVYNTRATTVTGVRLNPQGEAVMLDAATGEEVATTIDPETGEEVAVDPATGLPDPGRELVPATYTQGAGPLIDPTAILYVRTEDLVFNANRKPIALKPGVPVEPLILRARAGDCLKVDLNNALPASLRWTDPSGVSRPDMPGFSSLPPIIRKNLNADGQGSMTTFNASDLTPSSYVGLHAQLLAYNIRSSDGLDVGVNPAKVVPPGGSTRYIWYAGDVALVPNITVGGYDLVAKPVEFGAVNLLPADRIKGTGKGLVGAIVVEPQGAGWVVDPTTRASATVFADANGNRAQDAGEAVLFRDFVTIMQTDINLRYAQGCTPSAANLYCAVPAVKAEGGGVASDPQDSGQKAINYGADPLWYRLGVAPDVPFENAMMLDLPDSHRVFSNGLVGGDPQTAVYVASPRGTEDLRVRVLLPGGHARGIVYTLSGHAWQAQPYTDTSTRLGENPVGWWQAAQDGIGAGSHFNMLVRRGGIFNVTGDYLFRDFGSFGSFQGLWGILRHNTSAPQAAADAYRTPVNTGMSRTPAKGVLANDLDLDGDAMKAVLVSGPTSAYGFSFKADGSFAYKPLTGFAGSDSFTYKTCQSDGATCSEPTRVFLTVGSVPLARNDAYTMAANTTLTVSAGLLANDSDQDKDVIAPTLLSDVPSDQGTLSAIGADGAFSFTPAPNFVGQVSFTYVVCEIATQAGLCSDPATVTIKVTDSASVTSAVYTAATKRWAVSGVVTPLTTTPPVVNVYLTRNRTLLGTATLGAGGSWSLNLTKGVTLKAGDTVFAATSNGGESLPLVITVR